MAASYAASVEDGTPPGAMPYPSTHAQRTAHLHSQRWPLTRPLSAHNAALKSG